LSLGENFWKEEEKVSRVENELLEALFTVEEIRVAIFESYGEVAPDFDGFPLYFIKDFWNLIKNDLMVLVRDFEKDAL
jgi:hypothetical protein